MEKVLKPKDLPHVFERFYKADKAHNEFGTGLGLSIAAELAEQMGHTLSVTSAEGKGSIFTLSMPYARGCYEIRTTFEGCF